MYYLVRVGVAVTVAAIGITTALLVEGARLCRVLATDNIRTTPPTPAGFADPRLPCWVCGTNPATHVVEAKVLPQFSTALEDVESYYQLACADTVCLGLSAMAADARDMVHVDTRPIGSRAEAECISGLDLGATR